MARSSRASGSRQQAAQTGAVTIILLYCIGRGRGRANSHSDCCFLAVMPLLDRVQHCYCFRPAGGCWRWRRCNGLSIKYVNNYWLGILCQLNLTGDRQMYGGHIQHVLLGSPCTLSFYNVFSPSSKGQCFCL